MRAAATADGVMTTVDGMGMLWHEREMPEKYTLMMEFKTSRPQDNSGVFVRFPNPGNDPWVAIKEGYEIQVCEGNEKQFTGSIYNLKLRDEKATAAVKPPGEWTEVFSDDFEAGFAAWREALARSNELVRGRTWNVVAIFVVLAAIGAAVATAAALFLNQRSRLTVPARPIVYLPSVVPDAAFALLWLWLLNPLYGPLATVFGATGILTDPWGARIALPVISAFQIGEAFVVALAVRRSIPQSVFEAAAVDGASPWYTTTRLTLPLMAPVLGLLALRDLIFSLQVNFVPALLLTDGGPRYATTYLPMYVYRTAFRYFRLGYASTMALSMFLVTGLIVYIQWRLVRRWRART